MRKKTNRAKIALIIVLILVIAAEAALIFGGRICDRVRRAFRPIGYTDEIRAAAEQHGLDPAFVAAVVSTESRFRADAVSAVGAEGLMQVLPSTAEWIDYRRGSALPENGLFDPETNLDYGCWLLRYLLDRYGGNERYALIAYNAGFGRLDEWLNTPELLDGEGGLASIPYPETRAYVENITRLEGIYGELYEEELGQK